MGEPFCRIPRGDSDVSHLDEASMAFTKCGISWTGIEKADKTPALFANKSLISKALLGITKCNNSNKIEIQNKKGKL